MVSFGEKAKIKKAGNLNFKGRSYVTTTVTGLVIYNLAYTYKFQLKTTIIKFYYFYSNSSFKMLFHCDWIFMIQFDFFLLLY